MYIFFDSTLKKLFRNHSIQQLLLFIKQMASFRLPVNCLLHIAFFLCKDTLFPGHTTVDRKDTYKVFNLTDYFLFFLNQYALR